MSNTDDRAEFEAWLEPSYSREKWHTGEYTDDTVYSMFAAWQAARRAQVVDHIPDVGKMAAAPVQMPNVDTIGVMLELESRIPFVESQTTQRAIESAVQLLRILAQHGIK